jgi:pimeloyl-ACP methyl ester carboxylesterase
MSVCDFRQAEDRVFRRFNLIAERRMVDVPALGGPARVAVIGEGPPVLTIIGAGPPAALWAPLLAAMKGLTFYVVDLPGMGETHPVAFATNTVRETAVSFIGQLEEALGLSAPPIMAQSIGGLWSIWFALDRPDRVPGLMLVACPALIFGARAPLPLRLISLPMIGSLLMKLQPPSAKQVDNLASVAGESFLQLPELRDLWVELERLPNYGASLRSLIRANERLRGARPEVELTAEQLFQLGCPVRFVWGENDPFGGPELGRRAADIVPRADFHIVPGGHAPWLTEADGIAALASAFLRDLTGAEPS